MLCALRGRVGAAVRWALAARHAGWMWVGAVLCGAVAAVLSGVDLEIPFVPRGLRSTLPAPVVGAVLLAVVASGVARAGEPRGVRSQARNVIAHSIALQFAAVALYSGAAVLVLALGRMPLTEMAYVASTATAMAIIAMAARWLSSHPVSGSLPVLYLVLVTLFGRSQETGLRPWAWLLSRSWWTGEGMTGAVAYVSLGACLLAVAILLVTRRPFTGTAQDAPLLRFASSY